MLFVFPRFSIEGFLYHLDGVERREGVVVGERGWGGGGGVG